MGTMEIRKLLTYQEAAVLAGFNQKRLRRAASPATPFKKRLRVVRLGQRTVRIRPIDLNNWIERISSA